MNDKKKMLVVVLVGVIMITLIGGTFAYFVAQGNGGASRNVNVTTHTTDSLVFDIDKEITIDANQENFASGKGNQDDIARGTATLKANSATNTATATYNVFFLIDYNDYEYTTEGKTAELILSVKKNGTPVTAIEGLTPVTVGDVTGFDITERKDNIEIAKDETITVPADDANHTIEDIWEITVTLVNLDSDQNNNTGKTLNGRIYLSKNGSFLQVASAKTSKTTDSITVNLNMTDTGAEIDKYYFAIEENGSALALANTKTKVARLSNTNLTYYESDTPSYTFTGLTQGKKYNVYGYAQDTNGNKSNEYKHETAIISMANLCAGNTLAECIKKSEEYDDYLYHHDGSLTNGANDNSYRYSGAYESVNNWVCFGSSEETCPSNNLYRIIGVFNETVLNENGTDSGTTEDRVKLIMNNYPGQDVLGKAKDGTISAISTFTGPSKPSGYQSGYYWSGSASNDLNLWKKSTLNTTTLNGTSGNTYLTILGDSWSNKIATTKWKVGGNIYYNMFNQIPTTVYQSEIVNPKVSTTENKKIGLMYLSDYGFAASQENWNTTISKYNNDINKYNNWLYRGVSEWTIMRDSSTEVYAFYVSSSGAVSVGYVYENNMRTFRFSVRPVFSLLSSIAYAGGEGTENNPFRIN